MLAPAGLWEPEGVYLDTAGYPSESRLPPGYVPPAPVPLVEPASRNVAAPQPAKPSRRKAKPSSPCFAPAGV